MIDNEIKKIIGYGKPSNGCKECTQFKNHDRKGMRQVCFGFTRKDGNGKNNISNV